MGQNLCCMKQTSSENDHLTKASPNVSNFSLKRNIYNEKKHLDCSFEKNVKFSTLKEFLLDSPEVSIYSQCSTKYDHELQVCYKGYQKIYPASPDGRTDFFTPRISFSSDKTGALGRVDDESEDGSNKTSLTRRSQSGKVNKRVSFKFPEEADIIVFDPREYTFEGN